MSMDKYYYFINSSPNIPYSSLKVSTDSTLNNEKSVIVNFFIKFIEKRIM